MQDAAPRILAFLAEIGIPVRETTLDGPTFLPGVDIQAGGIVYDAARLLYPGDLLHEAGHLAVLPPEVRRVTNGDEVGPGGMELGAIAWSYAAALQIGLAPEVVFHEAGYRGGASNLLENFSEGRYLGVPILEWAEMTGRGEYPKMRRWVRESGASV